MNQSLPNPLHSKLGVISGRCSNLPPPIRRSPDPLEIPSSIYAMNESHTTERLQQSFEVVRGRSVSLEIFISHPGVSEGGVGRIALHCICLGWDYLLGQATGVDDSKPLHTIAMKSYLN